VGGEVEPFVLPSQVVGDECAVADVVGVVVVGGRKAFKALYCRELWRFKERGLYLKLAMDVQNPGQRTPKLVALIFGTVRGGRLIRPFNGVRY
jgi:hypothetical protein